MVFLPHVTGSARFYRHRPDAWAANPEAACALLATAMTLNCPFGPDGPVGSLKA
jgi:hypothetical protein